MAQYIESWWDGGALLPSVMQGSRLLPSYGSAKWWKQQVVKWRFSRARLGGFTSLPFIFHWSELRTMSIGKNEKLSLTVCLDARETRDTGEPQWLLPHLESIQRAAEWASLREHVAGTQNGIMRDEKPLGDFQVQLVLYMNFSKVTKIDTGRDVSRTHFSLSRPFVHSITSSISRPFQI